MTSVLKTYSELRQLRTIEERFKYLSLRGRVGDITFGFDRYLNQQFYTSKQWRDLRHHIIARDNGCDLGIEGYEIHHGLVIHHLQPMRVVDLLEGNPEILDPEFLITTTLGTHNAIHYGNGKLLPRVVTERSRNDTKLW
jgi:hypothetical protein